MDFTIVPMTNAYYPQFRENHLAAQAPDFARSFGISEEAARAFAEKNLRQLLPDGLRTKDNLLYEVRLSNGDPAGHLWLTAQEIFGRKHLFISDILVAPAARGRRIGRRLLAWAEEQARRGGFAELSLHVFGANAGARRLYEACGFAPTSIRMGKTL